MTEILDAPEIPIIAKTQFSAIMDGMWLNGRFLEGHSFINETFFHNRTGTQVTIPENKTAALFDSGTTLSTFFLFVRVHTFSSHRQ